MTEAQHYAPYRAAILTRDDLQRLTRLEPRIVIRDTLIDWAVIIAAWTMVALHPAWWTVLIAIVVVGTQYYALAIVGHDGLHRRLFEQRWWNDLWNDLMIMGPICAITRINRTNHIKHHLVTCLPGDPDRHKYLHDHKDGTFRYMFFLSGLQSIAHTVANIYVRPGPAGPRSTGANDVGKRDDARYTARDLAIIVGWQAALIGGLSYAIGWWAYPVLWLVPVYLFAYRADLVRVFCEHSMQMPDVDADRRKRMVTITSNALERRFFAPRNMNFHTAHHLWPSIPYYHLPEADRLIRAWVERHGPDEQLVWRPSYVGYIVSYGLWRRHTLTAADAAVGA
jgi:fatty acid desaturase